MKRHAKGGKYKRNLQVEYVDQDLAAYFFTAASSDNPAISIASQKRCEKLQRKILGNSNNTLHPSFRRLVRNIHNRLYGEGPIKMERRISNELLKLILCKQFDEKEKTGLFCITAEEFESEKGKKAAYNRIESIFNNLISDDYWRNVFKDDLQLEYGPDMTAIVILALQNMKINDPDLRSEILSEAYEVFIPKEMKGGRGQFFTPNVIEKLAVQISGLSCRNNIIDPAGGPGGFLRNVLALCPSSVGNGKLGRLISVDIEPSMTKLCASLLGISGYFSPEAYTADSLDYAKTSSELPVELGKWDGILTNPPFGTGIKIRSNKILSQFDLGHRLKDGEVVHENSLVEGQDPDRLFLEHCYNLAKDNGLICIVLPRQILSGADREVVEIRKWILKRMTPLVIIDFPSDAFQPFTGTITNLLILKKEAPPPDHRIFFALSSTIGHDRRGETIYLRDKSGELILDSDNLPTIDDDTPLILEKWMEYKKSGSLHPTNFGFLIPLDRIRNEKDFLLYAWPYRPQASLAVEEINRLTTHPDVLEIVSLKDVCERIFVPHRHKRRYVNKGKDAIPFISTAQILQIHEFDWKYQPRKLMENMDMTVEEGWILVTRSGSTGRVRYVDEELAKAAISEHCIRIVPDKNKIDSGYLYSFLSSKLGQTLLNRGRFASVVETLSHQRIGDIPVPLISMKLQKKIGDIVRNSESYRCRANKQRKEAITLLEEQLSFEHKESASDEMEQGDLESNEESDSTYSQERLR